MIKDIIYEVVVATHTKMMAISVNNLSKRGFRCAGGVSVVMIEGNPVFYQSMILERELLEDIFLLETE